MTVERASFSAVDYVVFVAFIAISAGLGLFFAVWPLLRNKRQSTKDIMLGNKEMHIIPVALTLVATFVSAISLLGYPADIYLCGTMFYWYGAMYFIAFPVSAFVYLPIFYNLGLTSAYQYLELRFSQAVRLSASGLFCFLVFAYMAVVLYAPALALSVVTTLSLPVSILTTGILATLYTSFGGAKAVVYTNTAQMLIIVCGLVGVVIAGSSAHGGLANVWDIAEKGHRIHFDDFRPDPRVRHSFWSLTVGGTATLLTLYAANQMTIQRYVSMPSLGKAQIALLLNIPVNLITITLYMLCGLILYAEYAGCDPVTSGALLKFDELLPYYVMDKLAVATGLPGLFVAALYSAGLSTLSGGLNAVASVVYVDFVKPLYSHVKRSELDDALGTRVLKAIALIFGVAAIGMAFAFSHLSSSVLQIALSIFGMVGGPLLGVFTLGMAVPWANSIGALSGLWTAFAVAVWIGGGAIANGLTKVNLPLGTEQCGKNTTSDPPTSFAPLPSNYNRLLPADASQSGGLIDLYSISYQYYALVAFLIAFLVGAVVSLLTGRQDPRRLNHRLLFRPWRGLACACTGDSADRCPQCGLERRGVEEDRVALNLSPAKSSERLAVEKTPFIDA